MHTLRTIRRTRRPARTSRAPGACLLLLSLLAPLALPAAADDGELRIGALPDESPMALLERFAPLGGRLVEALERGVSFTPTGAREAVVEALVAGRVDLAWLDGVALAQARLRSDGGVVPLVRRAEDVAARSVFIARADAGIDSLDDLAGRRLALGPAASSAGRLMPARHLAAAGIDVDEDLTLVDSAAQDATALAVADGSVDAGALDASLFEALVARGRIDPDEVVVIGTTGPYAGYAWSVTPGMDAATRAAIAELFLSLDPDDARDARTLARQRASRFVPAEPDGDEAVETAAREAGLLDE